MNPFKCENFEPNNYKDFDAFTCDIDVELFADYLVKENSGRIAMAWWPNTCKYDASKNAGVFDGAAKGVKIQK